MIDGLRAMLAGRRLVDLDDEFEIIRSLPHGHVASVLGCCASWISSGCSRGSVAASGICRWR